MGTVDLVTVGTLLIEVTPTTAGETLATAHRYTLVVGGSAANTVFALARLGVRVRFISAVGDDEFGTFACREMAAFGVDTASVRRAPGQLTPVSFCSVDGQGGKQFRFYRFPGYASPLQALTAEDFRAAADARIFDFGEGSIRDAGLRALVLQAAGDARAAGAPVLYNVNLRRSSWSATDAEIRDAERQAIALADIIVLNEEEARFVAGHAGEDGVRALREMGPRVVVMTRGGEGDILVGVGEALAAVSPYSVPVVYDVGAGDTFHAGLAAAALAHEVKAMSLAEWAEAARFGAAAAAIRVSTSADPHDLPTIAQVRAWMAGRAVSAAHNAG